MRSFCAHTGEDNKKVQVRQEFLGFVQAESTTGQALAERFLETQQGYGLDMARRDMDAEGCQLWGGKHDRDSQRYPSNYQGSRSRRSLYMSTARLTP